MTGDPQRDRYRRHKDRAGTAQREQSRAGRDIGPLPPVKDPKRKELGRVDFRRWIDTYFPQPLPWSRDHLRVIAKTQRAVLEGGQFALAMPRGSGKTTLAELACLWAVSYGHRQFVVLIGATEGDAVDRLDTNIGRIEAGGDFADDFPEVCHPIAQLEGIAHRCAGQLLDGERTQITWTKNEIVLPTVKGSAASGAIFKVAGIEGRIRGMKFQRPDGQSVRPDLVVIDDPQTDASARSLAQCVNRERIIAGAVLGLAGPSKKIAALMPCTVIRAGDVADVLLDKQKHPEWAGERTKLIDTLPTNTKLWDKYAEIRVESLRQHGDIRDATTYYGKHQKAMDEGAVVAWPERFEPGQLSAIQYALELKLKDEAAFWAEYQNEPMADKLEDSGILTVDQIAAKLHGTGEAIVPMGATRLTAFVDVQQKALYWLVVGWQDDTFSGFVVAYGAYPDQHREHFTLSNLQHTLAQVTKGAGVEGQIYAGLTKLVDDLLLGSEWTREDGTPMRVELCMIDANWGLSTEVVYQFCRQSKHAANVMPSHGRFFGTNAKPIREWAKKPGDRVGPGWHILGARRGGKRAQRRVTFDTNEWKTFVHSRLAVAMGDAGCLSLWGKKPARHRMLAEHLTSEKRERMVGTARVVDVWQLRPGAENHLLDCAVGAAVAASVLGVSLLGMDNTTKPRPKIRLSDLQRQRRRGA